MNKTLLSAFIKGIVEKLLILSLTHEGNIFCRKMHYQKRLYIECDMFCCNRFSSLNKVDINYDAILSPSLSPSLNLSLPSKLTELLFNTDSYKDRSDCVYIYIHEYVIRCTSEKHLII